MFIAGLVLGPIHHYFYGYMVRIMPARDMRTVTKKLLADQIIMSPLCIVAFFYGMGSMEGKTLVGCTEELKEKFGAVYMVSTY